MGKVKYTLRIIKKRNNAFQSILMRFTLLQ